MKRGILDRRQSLRFGVAICVSGCLRTASSFAANGDTLDLALAPPAMNLGIDVVVEDHIKPFIAAEYLYDSNLFRLPATGVDVASVVGPDASRADHEETYTAGIDAQDTFGNQVITLNSHIDDNRYGRNDNLDNVSGYGKLAWNWRLGNQLSGQVGADFTRSLVTFATTNIYSKDLLDVAEYYAAGRYQVGPHWAVFGGGLRSDTTLSDAVAKGSDFNSEAGEVGFEFVTGPDDSVGLEYRYTDASYTHLQLVQSAGYREDAAEVLVGYQLSDKTRISANGGYLRREYTMPTANLRGFSGDTWRASIVWQATEKTQIVGIASRDLQAFVSGGEDYYVITAESISPSYTFSDKVNFSFTLAHDSRNYLGGSGGLQIPSFADRRDKVSSEQINVVYIPIQSLSFKFSFGHENRSSNQELFKYDDKIASVTGTFKF